MSKNRGKGEYVVRHLLEEHTRHITVIVEQLNKDIEVLRDQIWTLDNGSQGTNNMVKALEMRHQNAIGDLRGRVARCDSSIAKLSAHLVRIDEAIQSLSNERQRAKLTLEGKIKDVEGQISQHLNRIEVSIREQEGKIKLAMKQNSEQRRLLDVMMKNISEDIKSQVLSSSSQLEEELARKEKELLHQIEWLSLVIKDKTASITLQNKIEIGIEHQILTKESSEKRLQEGLNHLSVKFGKVEEIQKMNSEPQGIKHLEKKLNAISIVLEKKIWKEVESIKARTNVAPSLSEGKAVLPCLQRSYALPGFTAIYESIGFLRQILEAKMKLDKEQLQNQILQLK
ncbi:protein FAM81A-like isoform X2 [Narcine bancroftii]|uniref:protein FAM81A-like isoform X2 n=1 Tax=Narcine bancroftii TaxID=1343680 RepID=UPI0038310272